MYFFLFFFFFFFFFFCIFSLFLYFFFFFFFSSRRRHTRSLRDWSSDVCSSDLIDWLPCCACGTYTTSRRRSSRARWRTSSTRPITARHVESYGSLNRWPSEIGRASCRERV